MRKKSLRKNKREGEKMRKLWLPLTMIIAILIPYALTLSTIFPEKVEAVTTEKQVVLDEDYAKVEASYEEKEDYFEWTIEFEKKASENEGRLRIAIDTTDTGFGTVSDIRGEGLASFTEEGDDLKTMKVENDEKDLDWYYTKIFSTEVASGTLNFKSEKTAEVGELPLVVAMDENVYTEELDTEKNPIAEENKEVEETNSNKDESTNLDKADSSIPSKEAKEDTLEESQESGGSYTGLDQSLLLKQSLAIRALSDDSSLELGPYATSDPFNYVLYEEETTNQRRSLEHATNDYANGKSTSLLYQGFKGPLFDNGSLITDENYDIGGANWRNYDYASKDNGSSPADGTGYGPTVQLWGTDQNFANSYLDYNGAYIKKWVEPNTDYAVLSEKDIEGKTEDEIEKLKQDRTVVYNVYLDVIGGEKVTQQAVDIVFVLDKSTSMDETIPDGTARPPSKFDSMTTSVTAMVDDLFEIDSLDLRIGMVDFQGYRAENIKSNIMEMTDKENKARLTNKSINNALYEKWSGSSATPITKGLKEGYDLLYKDDGGEGRNPEKILIIVGDGTPTYSYTGFYKRGTNNSFSNTWNASGGYEGSEAYWATATKTESAIFRDYETGEASLFYDSNTIAYPTEFDIDNYKGGPSQEYNTDFRYGEVPNTLTGNTNIRNNWYGPGTPSLNTQTRSTAAQTIAYHHWKKAQLASQGKSKAQVYSVGLGLASGNSNNATLDALGRNVLKNLADLKSEGSNESYYYSADTADELTKVLSEIAQDFVRTIQNATLYDATGKNISIFNAGKDAEITFYHLDSATSGDLRYEEPVEWNTTTHGPRPDVVAHPTTYEDGSSKNHAYRFEGISLGEGDMVRIKYQAKLDAGAQNGNFYTVNDEAYIKNQAAAAEQRLYFPAPSIRYLRGDRNLNVYKTGQDGRPLQGITLTLYYVSDDGNGNRELEEIESKMTGSNGMVSFEHAFNVLDNNDSRLYTVKETAGPTYYKLSEKEYDFQIKKVIRDMSDLEEDEETNDDENIEGIGHYELTDFTSGELKTYAEAGIEPYDDPLLWDGVYQGTDHIFGIYQTVNRDEGGAETTFKDLYVTLDLQNEIKPVELSLKKIRENSEVPLQGAEFSLQTLENGEYVEIASGTSDVEGKVSFVTGEKEPFYLNYELGTNQKVYRIVETKAPDGYLLPEDDEYWEVQLNANSESGAANLEYRKSGENSWHRISYSEIEGLGDSPVIPIEIAIENTLSKKEFRVKKVDESGNALNNVGFELRSYTLDEEGNRLYNAGTYKAYSGVHGENDKSTDGIGYFYSKLEEMAVGEDQNFDNPLDLQPGLYEVRETNSLLGYSSYQDKIDFELTENGIFEFENDASENEMYSFSETGGSTDDHLLTLTVKNTKLPMMLELQKVDSHTNEKLSGAEFTIKNSEDEEEKLVVNTQDGSIYSHNPIIAGTYTITETKSPDGYRVLPGYIEVTISEEDGNIEGTATYHYEDNEEAKEVDISEVTEDGQKVLKISFNVGNDPKVPLPSTGGQGREHYFLIAAAVIITMGAVGAIYVFRNRKGAK
ncbi:SpaA isopeptide-forming pilin-related protein [Enterococcus sp. AD013-P3]|uniref:SpaA isopeptide-forming pilin-related protein n=1 Tax=Enterococcus sp. AD013-P3 TaxID=3411036 RepID=UPI003B964D91